MAAPPELPQDGPFAPGADPYAPVSSVFASVPVADAIPVFAPLESMAPVADVATPAGAQEVLTQRPAVLAAPVPAQPSPAGQSTGPPASPAPPKLRAVESGVRADPFPPPSASAGNAPTPPATNAERWASGNPDQRLGILLGKLLVAGCIVAALALVWLLVWSDTLAPVRAYFFGAAAADWASRLLVSLIGLVIAMPLCFWLAIVIVTRGMGAAVPLTRARMEQSFQEAEDKVSAEVISILEKSLADMRAGGASEEEIEEVRRVMHETRETALATARARNQEMLEHPERIELYLEQARREIEARQTQGSPPG